MIGRVPVKISFGFIEITIGRTGVADGVVITATSVAATSIVVWVAALTIACVLEVCMTVAVADPIVAEGDAMLVGARLVFDGIVLLAGGGGVRLERLYANPTSSTSTTMPANNNTARFARNAASQKRVSPNGERPPEGGSRSPQLLQNPVPVSVSASHAGQIIFAIVLLAKLDKVLYRSIQLYSS